MELTFYSDPAHGWLEVPISLIDDLGIGGNISQYSYIKGDRAYLEEDCDLSLFMTAYQAKGGQVKFNEVYTNHDSWIRNLKRWSK